MLNTDELLYINTLKCRIKALRDRVKALEDGSVYQKMTSDCIALEHEKDREMQDFSSLERKAIRVIKYDGNDKLLQQAKSKSVAKGIPITSSRDRYI
jgi:hypothetical protein